MEEEPERKEKGREFRRRVRQELAKAERDMVHPDEILSEEEEKEVQRFLESLQDESQNGSSQGSSASDTDQVSGLDSTSHYSSTG